MEKLGAWTKSEGAEAPPAGPGLEPPLVKVREGSPGVRFQKSVVGKSVVKKVGFEARVKKEKELQMYISYCHGEASSVRQHFTQITSSPGSSQTILVLFILSYTPISGHTASTQII